jgi:hypothetical protein
MISLASDYKEQFIDDLLDENDVTVNLTCSEHEFLCDLLCQSIDLLDFAHPSGIKDFPENSETVQRYNRARNLHQRFARLWADRFTKLDNTITR